MTLRMRTAVFVAGAIILSVGLTMLAAWSKVGEAAMDAAKAAFAEDAIQEEEHLNTAFAARLAARAGALALRRHALRETALRARELLRALDQGMPPGEERERLKRRLLEGTSVVGGRTPGPGGRDEPMFDPVHQVLLNTADMDAGGTPVPGLALDMRLALGRPLRRLLESLDDDGSFGLLLLPSDTADDRDRPALAHFLPLDGERRAGMPVRVIMTMMFLDALAAESGLAELELIDAMREKFAGMAFHRRGLLALLDGRGGILAFAGDGTLPDGLASLLEEARKAGRVSRSLPSKDGDLLCQVAHIRAFGWHVAAVAPIAEIRAPSDELLALMLGVSLPLTLILILLAPALVMRDLRPLSQLAANARRLSEADFSTAEALKEVEPILSNGLQPDRADELGRVSRAFIRMGDALGANMRRLLETSAARTRMEGELAAAASIQLGMLPPPADVERICGLPAAAVLAPAREVGGDLYDVFALPDGRRALIVGDVSDKGVPAALFMAMTVTLARSELGAGRDPAEAMERVNAFLEAHNPGGMFVTLFMAILDADGGMIYANGGHCPPVIASARPDVPPRLIGGLSGPLVGALPGAPYVPHGDRLEDDEICLIFTDGVTEAMNAAKELYGDERLRNLVAAHRADSPADLIASILEDISRHRGGEPQSDDITMLAFRRPRAADGERAGEERPRHPSPAVHAPSDPPAAISS